MVTAAVKRERKLISHQCFRLGLLAVESQALYTLTAGNRSRPFMAHQGHVAHGRMAALAMTVFEMTG